MSDCDRCATYEMIGFGQMCPCTHVDGRCTTPQRYRAGRVPPVADKPLPSDPVSTPHGDITAMTPNNGILYVVVDLKADCIVGGVQLHRTDAAAIRAFGDVAANPETWVHKHPDDYELRRVGWLGLDNTITGVAGNEITSLRSESIITGTQWAAAQQQPSDNGQNLRLTEAQ